MKQLLGKDTQNILCYGKTKGNQRRFLIAPGLGDTNIDLCDITKLRFTSMELRNLCALADVLTWALLTRKKITRSFLLPTDIFTQLSSDSEPPLYLFPFAPYTHNLLSTLHIYPSI